VSGVTKVVYIAGWGRSGTTLLGNLLGQVEGCVSTGELHQIWRRGLLEGRACGCGLPLRECAMWQEAFEQGFGGMDHVDAADAMAAMRDVRTRYARRTLRQTRSGALLERCAYASYLSRLYEGIAVATGARVIVDSSKNPGDAVVAAGLPGVQTYVLHMVRDPRAVAFSWARRKEVADKSDEAGLLRRVGVVKSTLVWQGYNQVVSRTVRAAAGRQGYLRLSYEQLVTDPAGTIDRIIDLVGEEPSSRPSLDGRDVDLAPSHTASGNPDRFHTGHTSIRLDGEWRQAMSPWRRSAVALLASPTLARMGYGWRS
jgi:hypothetical protein